MSSASARSGWGPAATAINALIVATLALSVTLRGADAARDIVGESQRRADAKSQRYEGLLQVFDRKGRITDKRWTFERLGSNGRSKAVLRFTAPPEVKGVAQKTVVKGGGSLYDAYQAGAGSSIVVL